MKPITPILAIDPGREKCGVAILNQKSIELHEVVLRSDLIERIKQVLPSTGPIIIGDGTGSNDIKEELVRQIDNIASRIVIIREDFSTVEARTLYWQLNPPTGWRKFIPVTLQTPQVAVDDYVAIILAQRYQKLQLGNLRH